MALPDIPDVFLAVEQGHCDYGVVPIENSTEGAVNRSLDLLVDSDLTIIARYFCGFVIACSVNLPLMQFPKRSVQRTKLLPNVQNGCALIYWCQSCSG